MCKMIACLVEKEGQVYAKDGIHSSALLAHVCGVDMNQCLRYKFDLETRAIARDLNVDMIPFEVSQLHDQAAQRFFDECAGNPEKLMAFVQRDNWDEDILTRLLTDSARVEYDRPRDAEELECVKRAWVVAAREHNDGNAGYDASVREDMKVGMRRWVSLFKNPANRIEIWRK